MKQKWSLTQKNFGPITFARGMYGFPDAKVWGIKLTTTGVIKSSVLRLFVGVHSIHISFGNILPRAKEWGFDLFEDQISLYAGDSVKFKNIKGIF